jgi:hypothetical protein
MAGKSNKKSRIDFSGAIAEHELLEIEEFNLQIRGLDIKNSEPGIFGLGRPDPFFEIARKYRPTNLHPRHDKTQIDWIVVYRSEPKNNHINPLWQPLKVGMKKLCEGDLSCPLKLSVFDNNKRWKHKLIGETNFTVTELLNRISEHGNADRNQAISIMKDDDFENEPSGLICILQASIIPVTKKTKLIENHRVSKRG